MTWNTLGNATGADSIAQTAVAMEADIISLPETAAGVGEEVAVIMRDLGRPMWVHHEAYNEDVVDGPQAWQTTLLISPDLGDYSVIEASDSGTTMLPSAIAMPTNGDGPIVVAAHAVAPQPQYMDAWRSDLRWLADQCVEGNVIMAGDFNATLDHMSGLGEGDGDLGWCRDAAAENRQRRRGNVADVDPGGARLPHRPRARLERVGGQRIHRRDEPRRRGQRPPPARRAARTRLLGSSD